MKSWSLWTGQVSWNQCFCQRLEDKGNHSPLRIGCTSVPKLCFYHLSALSPFNKEASCDYPGPMLLPPNSKACHLGKCWANKSGQSLSLGKLESSHPSQKISAISQKFWVWLCVGENSVTLGPGKHTEVLERQQWFRDCRRYERRLLMPLQRTDPWWALMK